MLKSFVFSWTQQITTEWWKIGMMLQTKIATCKRASVYIVKTNPNTIEMTPPLEYAVKMSDLRLLIPQIHTVLTTKHLTKSLYNLIHYWVSATYFYKDTILQLHTETRFTFINYPTDVCSIAFTLKSLRNETKEFQEKVRWIRKSYNNLFIIFLNNNKT